MNVIEDVIPLYDVQLFVGADKKPKIVGLVPEEKEWIGVGKMELCQLRYRW